MPAIRKQVNIAASPRSVWRALTTSEGLEKWLSDTARVDPREGGRVVLGEEGADGANVEARGFIHTWRPTSHLEIAWDTAGTFETRGSRMSFQLARDGEETRLNLVHSGGEALEDEGRRSALDQKWRTVLATLQEWLDAR